MSATATCWPSDDTLDRAIADHRAGRVGAAEAGYRSLLESEPDRADACHLLGLLACERGEAGVALIWVERALFRDAARAAFHNTRARALVLLERIGEAQAAYERAWQLRPGSAEIANNLGCLLRGVGQLDAAVDWLRRARGLAPRSADIAVNLAGALQQSGRLEASLAALGEALALRPDGADGHDQMGRLHLARGRPVEAEVSFRTALLLRPGHAASANDLGVALERQGRGEAAAECFAEALRFDPHSADAHYNLGCLLQLDNRIEEARQCHRRALACDPLHGRAHWASCMAELPLLYETCAQIGAARARYGAALAELAARAAADAGLARALAASAGASQPFFLPSQGQCDYPLQAQYGALLGRLIPSDPAVRQAAPPGGGERIRLGFVTGHACEHTIWRLMLHGWLAGIDRSRFQLLLYDATPVPDAQSAIAAGLCERHVRGDAAVLRAAILGDRPHALIYPEIGMDPACARLAVERLAPLQCVGWGQPQTTGLPQIDCFLSGAAMEPADAALHYTERLVCLPGLGVRPMPQAVVPAAVGRAAFGLRAEAMAFWCGQAIYKYLPQHDAVFVRIAAARPDSQFLFIDFARSRVASGQFRARLGRAFAVAGLDAERHCVFLGSMDQARFCASAAVCDIVLDSIGWSGGKSTLDLLAASPVIVTQAGGLMRGRHTAAILRLLGITETIVHDTDQYVATALRLAADAPARAALRARLAAARQAMLDDMAPIRALEAFLEAAVRSGRCPTGLLSGAAAT